MLLLHCLEDVPEAGVEDRKQVHILNAFRDSRWDLAIFNSYWDEEDLVERQATRTIECIAQFGGEHPRLGAASVEKQAKK